jgi:hypothetical protein
LANIGGHAGHGKGKKAAKKGPQGPISGSKYPKLNYKCTGYWKEDHGQVTRHSSSPGANPETSGVDSCICFHYGRNIFGRIFFIPAGINPVKKMLFLPYFSPKFRQNSGKNSGRNVGKKCKNPTFITAVNFSAKINVPSENFAHKNRIL